MSTATTTCRQPRSTRRGSYGGMTASEYAARLDAWGHEMLAALERRTPAERDARRRAWRAYWDDAYWQATQRLAGWSQSA